jgi:hypothetical protein
MHSTGCRRNDILNMILLVRQGCNHFIASVVSLIESPSQSQSDMLPVTSPCHMSDAMAPVLIAGTTALFPSCMPSLTAVSPACYSWVAGWSGMRDQLLRV